MATKTYDESSRMYTYGYPGAEFATRDQAVAQAEYKFNAVKREYPGQIRPSTFMDALQDSGRSLQVKMTRVVG